MKITFFGDSFVNIPIVISGTNTFTKEVLQLPSEREYQFQCIVAKTLGADMESFGYPGSSGWDAVMQFLKKDTAWTESDVVVFCWSNPTRFYHKDLRDICITKTRMKMEEENPQPIWQAADMYFKYLYDYEKEKIEHEALMYWFNDMLREKYPDTKFIHMSGFPHNTSMEWDNPETFDYHCNWSNSVEIRPALIYLSFMDGWPGDTSNEIRQNHLTHKMHKFLADILVDIIKNYSNGTIVDYTSDLKKVLNDSSTD